MPVFSIPLSGLTASSTALSAIANNLANLNTVGYKQTRVTFRDLFYQNVGSSASGNPIQVGAGAAVGSVSTIFSGNNVEASGINTDVAIMGDGFFVLHDDGVPYFSRAGNFQPGTNGDLLSEDGKQVMGYVARNGVLDPASPLSPIQIGKGQISPARATTSMQLRANLDANTTVGESFSTPMTVYDSLGASHVLSFRFTKSDVNEWDYQITLPAEDTGGTGAATVLRTGTIQFDGKGQIVSPTSDVTGINITGLASGASNLSLSWKLADAGASLITQAQAKSNAASTRQDGFGSGTLTDFAIAPDGSIQGTFSNGTNLLLGQLALANFANPQGLEREGRNCFRATLASGSAVIGTPGTGGRGSVAGGALELSNVDIAKEFAQMILAQRGFQANARAITTFDEITQETINLKR